MIKLLIMDRKFIDGAMITRFKKIHEIDCLVPLKSNMHALMDALGISRLGDVKWVLSQRSRMKREGSRSRRVSRDWEGRIVGEL